ncbi:AAA family ATPase [Aeromonas enteropelogenes]|uniref:AAA family ATPase n=1 Tax=Aeromonas enteropelogenes TaxID=29489 RepID=UPI003BA10F50
MKIKRVEIEGFRAYKTKEDGTFDFTVDGDKPSNFVAIYAPNGFGKSSFYDAVEWAVTNHLERLGGEYNRGNYEHAAKITKENGVSQKILRNKYISNDALTRVIVSTTRPKKFDRSIRNIRSNSRDLRLGNNKDKVNDFFRKVILSQDEIDRFLREAKPQERYNKFMESFGGDIEVARKELSILINDNKTILTELERQRQSLHLQLQEPIDTSVFNKFNQIILELNDNGENLSLVDKDFSVTMEHKILSSLVKRTHELKVLREKNKTSHDVLIEQLSILPEIQLHFNLIAEIQPKLSKLSKGVLDAQRYQTLLASNNKCLSELQNTSKRLEMLIELESFVEEYANVESELITAIEKQNTLAKQHQGNVSLLEVFEASEIQQNKDLAEVDSRSMFLKNAIQNSDSIYAEISTHNERLALLKSQVSEKDLALNLDKAQYENLESELTKVSALKITAHSLLTSDISAIKFDDLKLQKLTNLSAELDTWARHDKTIQATQHSLNEQMDLHERLIAMGLDYLSLWPTQTCPLCNKPHESTETLRAQVKNNAILSNLSRDNSEKLAASSKRQNDLKKSIETITREALEAQSKRLKELRINVNELGAKRTTLELEKANLVAEINAVEKIISDLQGSVWGLVKTELISRAEGEINSLSDRRKVLLAKQSELREHIDRTKSLLVENTSSINSCKTYIESLTSRLPYKKIREYLKDNSLPSDGLKTHLHKNKVDLEAIKDKQKSDADEFLKECNTLHETMLADGNWIDLSTLTLQKELAEADLTKSQSVVVRFFEGLSETIGKQTDKSLTEIQETISIKISELASHIDSLDNKSNKLQVLMELLNALKPYFTHISSQEKLVKIEGKIKEHSHVDIALTNERNIVISKLKELVDNFFYEDLINSIYRKIDPHPSFKKVAFKPDFDSDKPGLNLVVNDSAGESISPILYFSSAQSNILSLSVFLANALHAKDDEGNSVDVIMIDDPIQSMDSINILSTIDLLRSICLRFGKQIIISTHDENFFGLLQRKLPSEVLGSKFLKLEKFGVVVPVKPFTN